MSECSHETTIQLEKETRESGEEGGREGGRDTREPLSASHCIVWSWSSTPVRPSPSS